MKTIDNETIRKYRTWPTQWTINKIDKQLKHVFLRNTGEFIGCVHRQCNGNGKIEWVIFLDKMALVSKTFEQMNQAADYLYTNWRLKMEEEKERKKTYVVTFEATTARSYSVKADSFEEAHTKATKELYGDETVTDVWTKEAEVVGMSVTAEGKEFLREQR